MQYFSRISLKYGDDVFAVFDTNKLNIDVCMSFLNYRFSSIISTFKIEDNEQLPLLDMPILEFIPIFREFSEKIWTIFFYKSVFPVTISHIQYVQIKWKPLFELRSHWNNYNKNTRHVSFTISLSFFKIIDRTEWMSHCELLSKCGKVVGKSQFSWIYWTKE